LGLGDTTNRSNLTQVGSDTAWQSTSANQQYTTLAIKSNGTLWSWGYNYYGQLGTGNITNYSSPKQVGALTNWLQVATNSNASLALKTDGTLWAWGFGYYGQLGLGNQTNYSSPKQIGSGTNWLQISADDNSSYALRADGTLWAWGYNYYGELGTGDVSSRYSPVQIGSNTNWMQITSGPINAMALRADGTLWAWGYNGYGQLGTNDTTNRSSPQQVGSLTTWVTVNMTMNSFSSFAIKTDGTLWSWGRNDSGQLGLNDTSYRSSPVQIGALTNWLQISGTYNGDVTTALKTDGTLWSWGYNGQGQLGLGNTTSYSSPKQIGSLSTWVAVSGSMAIHT
jgi:alpha-tubulin suppressor-like RCC1 family protein